LLTRWIRSHLLTSAACVMMAAQARHAFPGRTVASKAPNTSSPAAATIGSTPAVVNAVVDALKPLGVKHLDMPLKPERIWVALQAKKPPQTKK